MIKDRRRPAWPIIYSPSFNGIKGRARDYYHVGVLEIDEIIYVHEALQAPLFVRNHKEAKHLISQLTDLHKTYALAGSKSGNHLTPYKRTMMDVRKVIQENPGCTIGFLHETLGDMHYYNEQSFKGNLLKCLDSFETWCRIDKTSKPYKLYISSDAPAPYQYGIEHFIKGETK